MITIKPASRKRSRSGQESDADRFVAAVDAGLRPIAVRCVRVWFNRPRLDEVLGEVFAALPDSELVYAVDIGGRQVSANLHPEHVDTDRYGQDLSGRPITVPLGTLGENALRGAFLCGAYVSQVTGRDCVTALYPVHGDATGTSLLGFIAVDFDPSRTAIPGA